MKTIAAILISLTLVFSVNAADALTEKLQRGLFEEEANRNLDAAIKEYQSVVAQSDEQRKLVATALFRLGECYRKLGRTNEAHAHYQRILRDFSEQEQLVRLSRGLLPRRTAELASGTVTDPAAANLLREEIQLAERTVQVEEQKLAAGKTSLHPVLDAKKEVLRLKRQLPENAAPDKQRTLIDEQIRIVQQLLSEFQKRIQVGTLPPLEDLPIQRELLALQRELATVGDVAKVSGESGATLTQAEAEELARVKALAQNSPDLLDAPHNGFTPLQFAAAQGFPRLWSLFSRKE
jgi:tetratricopeptide (TPR) repeat protein